jgi:steroid Delta-isomerase
MSFDRISKVVTDYFAAIQALDLEAWLDTFAPDAVSHEPGNPPLQGLNSLRMFFNGVVGGFEEIKIAPDRIFVVGDEAAVKWTAKGMGKNGRTVIFEGIDLFTINGLNKIQEVKAFWDPEAMMAELMD